MDKVDLSNIPENLKNLTPAQLAEVVKFAEEKQASTKKEVPGNRENGLPNTTQEPIENSVAKTGASIEGIVNIPEGSVSAQILSPENHKQALSAKEALTELLSGEIDSSKAKAALDAVINKQSKN
jgi:hypothetical protein